MSIIIKQIETPEVKFKPCIECGRLTCQKNTFADDCERDEDGNWVMQGYKDYCHDECYAVLLDKMM